MRRTFLLRPLVILAAVFFVALSTVAVPAASAAVQNRIGAAITNNGPVEIPHSVHPRASLATDLGPAPADMKLVGMSLRFSMTDAQQTALDQLLADQQNPASPRYHQWLTPTQFAAQFGLSSADIAKVTAWLTAQGFTVTGVANGGTFITFDGTVAQAQTAFATSIHNVSSEGETHFANLTNASVPGTLAGVVGSITGLHNFHARAHVRAVASPRFTSATSGNHYLAPGDLYTIYDMKPLLATETGAGIGTGANCHSVGSPQSACGDIAVTGQVDLTNASGTPTDVLAFRTAAGLSTTNLPTTVHEGGDPGPALTCTNCFPNAGDLEESSLDVEWSGAMAPGATILFVNGPDVLLNSMTQAIDQNLAPIVTTSYGNCEASWGSTDLNTFNQLFKQAATQGQTVIAAAGDAGAADCDVGIPTVEGLTVDFPASSPYVSCMGGTMVNEGTATGATTYWNSNSSSTSANAGSATGYLPEVVWNEDTAGFSFSAGGGGVSDFFTKPAWQVETGPSGMTTSVPADASRDVPDLALDAATGHDGYLFCYSASCVTGFRTTAGNLTVAGGTSFDSQAFGGMLALVEQKIGTRIGNANPTLYALGNKAAYYNTTGSSVFHDITSGNNNNLCTAGTPDCPNGGSIGYSAGTGYDLVTGWGSVDLNNLASDWNLVTPLGVGSLGSTVSATALTASATSVTSGTTVTLTATVTGSAATPTGTVQFLDNNAALGAPVALNSGGVATYSYVTSCSTLGQQNMTAAYSGDATYAGSKGPALRTGEATTANITSNGSVITTPLIVTVTSSSCPDFSATSSSSTVTVAAGGTIPPVTITITPTNGFTGTVTFSASSATTSGVVPTVSFTPSSLTFTSSNNTVAQTTSVTLSGITAELRLPGAPGQPDSGIGMQLARTSPVRAPSAGRSWYATGWGAAVACLLLLTLPRRRRLGGLLLVALSIALIGGAAGCGGGSSSTTTTNTNPDIGTYTVTVIATYGSGSQATTHSTTITYIIN